jgi:hypothetical protein
MAQPWNGLMIRRAMTMWPPSPGTSLNESRLSWTRVHCQLRGWVWAGTIGLPGGGLGGWQLRAGSALAPLNPFLLYCRLAIDGQVRSASAPLPSGAARRSSRRGPRQAPLVPLARGRSSRRGPRRAPQLSQRLRGAATQTPLWVRGTLARPLGIACALQLAGRKASPGDRHPGDVVVLAPTCVRPKLRQFPGGSRSN